MQTIMESLGGWPILKGENWDENLWTYQEILLKLGKLGLETSQIFSAFIDADMKNSTARKIYVRRHNLNRIKISLSYCKLNYRSINRRRELIASIS